MFTHSLKIILRNLKKRKGISLINIAGLTIGIIGFILIALFVQDELSYDRRGRQQHRILQCDLMHSHGPGLG